MAGLCRGRVVSQFGYVFAAWSVTLIAGGLYALALRVRGHRLMRRIRAVTDHQGAVSGDVVAIADQTGAVSDRAPRPAAGERQGVVADHAGVVAGQTDAVPDDAGERADKAGVVVERSGRTGE